MTTHTTVTGRSLTEAEAHATHLAEQLRAEQDTNLLLTESLADMQLALEDKGWVSLQSAVSNDFTPEGRKALRSLCRSMAIANPLIKRGLTIRIGYVWGQGVQVRARAAEDADQDVNSTVQAFVEANTATLTGDQAHEALERGAATDGDVYIAAFTDPLTGSVRCRTALADEVHDIITNPDDRDEPWYYIRHVPKRRVEPGYAGGTRTRVEVEKVAHPALGFYPTTRPRSIDSIPVRWDAPILHVKVNQVAGWRFGVPDVYASVAWARMYKEFLVDWAQLTRSLSKYAWQATGGTPSQARKTAAQIAQTTGGSIRDVPPVGGVAGPGSQTSAGQAAVSSGMVKMEAISKSGATIDANSGKPLAGMAAAGLGLPVTMLLADPGVTGARAVAETLDLPTILEMGMRRLMWQGHLSRLYDYVIDQAVLAPRGPLKGRLQRDEWGHLSTVLTGDVERTIEWDWPPLVDVDPVQLISAIVEAAGTELVPPLVLLRLLLSALGIKDADEILAEVTDERGQFVPPTASAGDEAVRRLRQGDDPATVDDDDPAPADQD